MAVDDIDPDEYKYFSIESVVVDRTSGAVNRYVLEDVGAEVELKLNRHLDELEKHEMRRVFNETAGDAGELTNFHAQGRNVSFRAKGSGAAIVFIDRLKTEGPQWTDQAEKIMVGATKQLESLEETLKRAI